jgi:hypothetical protein
MVHGNDDGPVRLAIQDALQPDRLSDLAHVVRDVYSEIKDGGRMKEEENGMTGVDGTGHLWATRPAERLNIFEYFHRGGLI